MWYLFVAACTQAAQGVMAYVGPISSTPTKAVAIVSAQLKIPQIAPVATNPLLGKLPQNVDVNLPDL